MSGADDRMSEASNAVSPQVMSKQERLKALSTLFIIHSDDYVIDQYKVIGFMGGTVEVYFIVTMREHVTEINIMNVWPPEKRGQGYGRKALELFIQCVGPQIVVTQVLVDEFWTHMGFIPLNNRSNDYVFRQVGSKQASAEVNRPGFCQGDADG